MTKLNATLRVGAWSAVASAALAIVYVIGQVLEWRGLLGSAGGPGSTSTPLGIAILLTPSLLLGAAFVIMMAALHQAAPASKRVFSQAGLAFATMYATLVSLVYFVQLTLVAPRLAAGDMAEMPEAPGDGTPWAARELLIGDVASYRKPGWQAADGAYDTSWPLIYHPYIWDEGGGLHVRFEEGHAEFDASELGDPKGK